MPRTTVKFADKQEFEIECPGCEGSGISEAMNRTMPNAPNHPCPSCMGKGRKTVVLEIPKPGRKVSVKIGNQPLLDNLFGMYTEGPNKGQPKVTHRSVAIVYDVQTPEEHMMEFTTGVGVRVAFDGLSPLGKIPKGKEVDLWTFDLYELKLL